MATSNELTRIADAVNALRPEWVARSVRALLDRPELRDRGFADLAVAFAVVAGDPKSATPARILEPGPWWLATKVNSGTPVTQTPGSGAEPACDRPGHEHELARACRACRAEQITDLAADRVPQIATPAPENFRATVPRRAPQPHDRRDFAQIYELPTSVALVQHCQCSATFFDTGDGRKAHRTVFGHEPAARPVGDAATGPGQGAETMTGHVGATGDATPVLAPSHQGDPVRPLATPSRAALGHPGQNLSTGFDDEAGTDGAW